MPIAKSVEDTVLGEALAGNYQDMLGIVSVIDNRSKSLGVTYDDVVATPGQFDAYGKAMPPGVGKYRDMAQQAISEVRSKGPVHTATFYATPAAARGLPPGLSLETKTAGHQFYSDPQGRPIATAQGYKTPDPSAISAPQGLTNVAGAPSDTLYSIAEDTAPATASLSLPDVGPTPASKPSVAAPAATGLGLAALATPADMSRVSGQKTGGLMSFSPPSTAVRSMSVDPALTGIVSKAVSKLGPDYGWQTTSGGQPAKGTSQSRVGSTRHDMGRAIDGYVTKAGVALNPVENRQAYMDALTNLAEEGAKGLGHYGWGIHADVATPASWGPSTSSKSLDPGFGLAIGQGRALSGLDGAYPTPTPDPRDTPAMPGRSQVDPRSSYETVTSAPLAPVDAPRSAMPGRSLVTPTAPPTVEQQVVAMTPAIAMPTQMPHFAPAVAPAVAPPVAVPIPTKRAVVAPPRAVVAPPAIAPASRAAAPQQAAPVAPMATASDVWGGKAATGRASNGSMLSRNDDGTLSFTSSKYGYTDTWSPTGEHRGTTAPGLFGIDAAARSIFGGVAPVSIPGPLGQTKGVGPQSKTQATPSRQRSAGIGPAAKGMTGAVAGGLIGGLLGPVGGMLGAMVGRNLAMGKTATGQFKDFTGLAMPTPTQARTAFARGFTPGLGFPTAPSGNASQGGLTSFGEAASRGDHGGQAQAAANSPGMGLY